jgi:integrase
MSVVARATKSTQMAHPSLASAATGLRCAAGPWSWVTSHTFRKTVATRLDEAGFTARQVADQLGHANPSMTLDVYFGRHVVSSAVAAVLDR